MGGRGRGGGRGAYYKEKYATNQQEDKEDQVAILTGEVTTITTIVAETTVMEMEKE